MAENIMEKLRLTTDKSKQQKTLEVYHEWFNDKVMIRKVCWKLEPDRLGNILKVIK